MNQMRQMAIKTIETPPENENQNGEEKSGEKRRITHEKERTTSVNRAVESPETTLRDSGAITLQNHEEATLQIKTAH